MSKIDPRLQFVQAQRGEELSKVAATERFGLEVVAEETMAKVLLRFRGDLKPIEEAGFQLRTVAGDIATGTIPLDKVDDVASLENVIAIESSRPLSDELDVSLAEIRANNVHAGPPSFRGKGTIVGIIDSGIDFRHASFGKADGSSRVLAIWDQSLTPQQGESHPDDFAYGVEYEKSEIDAALADEGNVRHTDRATASGHGTHVTGIAAGDGSAAGNGQPPFTFVGVAPESDIIVVANRVQTQALGDSASTLDAVNYILKKAGKLARPVVINQSQGDNLGPHDGTSLLERGIDNLLDGPGKSMVKSAGNAGNDDIHAQGKVQSGGRETVGFLVPDGDTNPDTIDIWYRNADRFKVEITTPSGETAAIVEPGSSFNESLDNGNRLFVVSVVGDPNNNDNRIFLQLAPQTEPIEPGEWSFTLEGVTVEDGEFHAWIERGRPIPIFLPPHVSSERTISIPGTSRKVIAVGSQITKGPGAGSLSGFSSQGPSRDGRPKPEISAPGQQVMSARAANISRGDGEYHLLPGTSMAAPHVAGTIALMLEANPTLTQDQILECLTSTARSDQFTGEVPNHQWGHGKLDAQAAVKRAREIRGDVKQSPDQAELARLADLVDDALSITNQLLKT